MIQTTINAQGLAFVFTSCTPSWVKFFWANRCKCHVNLNCVCVFLFSDARVLNTVKVSPLKSNVQTVKEEIRQLDMSVCCTYIQMLENLATFEVCRAGQQRRRLRLRLRRMDYNVCDSFFFSWVSRAFRLLWLWMFCVCIRMCACEKAKTHMNGCSCCRFLYCTFLSRWSWTFGVFLHKSQLTDWLTGWWWLGWACLHVSRH